MVSAARNPGRASRFPGRRHLQPVPCPNSLIGADLALRAPLCGSAVFGDQVVEDFGARGTGGDVNGLAAAAGPGAAGGRSSAGRIRPGPCEDAARRAGPVLLITSARDRWRSPDARGRNGLHRRGHRARPHVANRRPVGAEQATHACDRRGCLDAESQPAASCAHGFLAPPRCHARRCSVETAT